ncbi:MAG: hypothetical protein JSS00_02900 [Proteobacteria bacterium]|nr:hypothetical protein [Pseudomonadota bacterium]
MTSPSDPFSAFFDSVEIDPITKPSPEVIERAFAMCAPPQEDSETPGFHLIDDAGGRFVVDPITGVISLRDDLILERERGAIHLARLRVIEPSGERYELDLKLRLSGRVPQLVSQEDAMSDMTAAVERDDEDVTGIPRIHWTRYVAIAGLYTPATLAESDAPYGAMLAVHLPNVAAGFAGLTLIEEIPPPSSRTAIWTP